LAQGPRIPMPEKPLQRSIIVLHYRY
jgi:hypothetical protein